MAEYSHQMKEGDRFQPLHFTVTREINQQYLFAQEDFHPRFLPGNAERREIAHPALMMQMLSSARAPDFRLPGNVGAILASADTEFHRPAYVGEPYTTNWQVVRTYSKRGHVYHDIQAEVSDHEERISIRRLLRIAYVEKTETDAKEAGGAA